MSDWQKGDLALCVAGGLQTKTGRVYTVCDVIPPNGRRLNPRSGGYVRWTELCLRFIEVTNPPNVACNALRFRKITPGAKIEGIEEPRRLPVKERTDA